MTRARARVVAAVLSVATMGAMLGGQPAFADGGGGKGPDNIVEVRNTRDNSSRSRSKAVVTHEPGGTVDNTNVASAWPTCTDCRTAAAAVQMVIVEGAFTPPLVPENHAYAINDNCTRCVTFAYARQVVFVVGRPVRIGDDAEDRIEDINEEMADVVRSGATPPEMEAELDALTEQMVDVVRDEIQRSGSSGGEHDHRDTDDDEDDEDDD